jgi:hypothetical protein
MPGIGISKRVSSWPGPGIVYSPRYEEGVHRNLYRFYAELMSTDTDQWPQVVME